MAYTLEQLRGLVAVAVELHFGRAAARLRMTQPPLSRQIQKLEQFVGTRLLERNNRGVALTTAGSAFLTEARRLLAAADVFVLPSRHEGMPLVALEAMEAGLAVVGTRVIGTEEVVEDGVTGALVRPGDPAALGAALARLLADPALRRRQGDAGRRRYQACFTRERMARDTAAVYESVLRGARR